MTLYEIAAEIEDCIIIDESGEIIGVDSERLEALEMEREKKRVNIACWIKNLEAAAAAIAEERKALEKRQKAATNRAESLRVYLLNDLGGEILDTPKARVSYHNSESTEITCSDDIPETFRNYSTEWKPDKAAIKKAIKGGQNVPGAAIEKHTTLVIK